MVNGSEDVGFMEIAGFVVVVSVLLWSLIV